ncbi:OmpA family protein [Dysgonomonas sp. Marseille-P4677]|uniref:OmpA family protein n=1 Tax=Dysgonomonas sp. Marseille-P4677 TaxID=2364790 RepID=UPI001911C6A0|nr:OmpA family protein [Dysgonomonas sp. Marseille-P4677]MBK5722264.1 OmpA family protein [Dysgonomonas sp. Marseille-P4677]
MRKISFLFLFLLITGMILSQDKDGFSTDLGKNTTFVKNGFWDNWFIGAGAGANIYFGDHDADAKFFRRLTVTPNFQLGTWFNPYYGGRLKLTGGTNIHTFNENANLMSRQRYVGAELNFLWNMTDYLCNYNAKRVYNFIPYIGMGWAYTWDYKNFPENFDIPHHINSATVDLGIIHRFRFSERAALDIEMSGKLMRNKSDLRTDSKGYDVLGTVSASLVFNIGSKATFTEAIIRDQREIDELNNKINAQRMEIERLAQRPEVVSRPEPTVVVKEVIKEVNQEPVNNVVLFNINKTKVEPHQEVNVYNVAKYLRDNPNSKVRIVGYTDRATGTPTINEKLSRERAQNVADLIIGKYSIDKSRVNIQWEGQANPPFSVDEWNRAVILYIE